MRSEVDEIGFVLVSDLVREELLKGSAPAEIEAIWERLQRHFAAGESNLPWPRSPLQCLLDCIPALVAEDLGLALPSVAPEGKELLTGALLALERTTQALPRLSTYFGVVALKQLEAHQDEEAVTIFGRVTELLSIGQLLVILESTQRRQLSLAIVEAMIATAEKEKRRKAANKSERAKAEADLRTDILQRYNSRKWRSPRAAATEIAKALEEEGKMSPRTGDHPFEFVYLNILESLKQRTDGGFRAALSKALNADSLSAHASSRKRRKTDAPQPGVRRHISR